MHRPLPRRSVIVQLSGRFPGVDAGFDGEGVVVEDPGDGLFHRLSIGVRDYVGEPLGFAPAFGEDAVEGLEREIDGAAR